MKLKKKKLLQILLRIENKAQNLKIFGYGSKYLIAVSGGQDSICLSIFLRNFQRKLKLQFDVVYCHHAWQQEKFFNVLQITKYAAYTETGCFIFLNCNSPPL